MSKCKACGVYEEHHPSCPAMEYAKRYSQAAFEPQAVVARQLADLQAQGVPVYRRQK